MAYCTIHGMSVEAVWARCRHRILVPVLIASLAAGSFFLATSDNAAALDTCSLIAIADVEPVLGGAVASVTRTGDGGCQFLSGTGTPERVTVRVDRTGGRVAMRVMTAAIPMTPEEKARANGFGGDVLIGPMDSAWYVLKGDRLVAFEWPVRDGSHESKHRLAANTIAKL